MKNITFLILIISSTASFAGTSVIERLVSKKTTETFSLSNGIYKRIASKTEGKVKFITKVEGQDNFEEVFNFPENDELFSEKFITPKSNKVKIKLVTPTIDGFEGREEIITLAANITVENGKVLNLTIGGNFLKEMMVNQITSELKNSMVFSFPEGEVNPDNINVVKMKVQQSDIKCIAKANKLYCQESLKLHAVITLEK